MFVSTACIPLSLEHGQITGTYRSSGWEATGKRVKAGGNARKEKPMKEASLKIRPVRPQRTYLVDWDHGDSELKEMRWEGETDQEPTPQLVVT